MTDLGGLSASADSPAGAQANPPGEAEGFAAVLAGSWFVPFGQNPAEPCEELIDAQTRQGAENNPAMPETFTGAAIDPFTSLTQTPADFPVPPGQGTDSEPVPAAAFSIANLFVDDASSDTGAEFAGPAAGMADAQAATLREASLARNAAMPDVTSEAEALTLSFRPRPKNTPEPVPMPVTLADPPFDINNNGGFPRGQALGPQISEGARQAPPSDDQARLLLRISDVAKMSNLGEAGGLSLTPTPAPVPVFFKGLLDRSDWKEATAEPIELELSQGEQTDSAAAHNDGIGNVLLKPDGKSDKASLLETMFREVARAAAESQPPAASFKEMPAATRRQAEATGNDRPVAEATEAADSATAGLATGNAAGANHTTDGVADSEAAAVARQIINPLLEVARTLGVREARRLRLELRPEKFGQIELEITRGQDGRLSAQFAAARPLTQQALADGIHQLRQSLEQAGLSIDRLEISLALDLQGKAHSHTAQEEAAAPVYGSEAKGFSSEQTVEAREGADSEQRRLLSLRI